MQQNIQNNQAIDAQQNQWNKVVQYYLSLPGDFDRQLYLGSMDEEQRNYLLLLTHQSAGLLTNNQSETSAVAEENQIQLVNDERQVVRVDEIERAISRRKRSTSKKAVKVVMGSFLLVGFVLIGMSVFGGSSKVNTTKLVYANMVYGSDYDQWAGYLGDGSVMQTQDDFDKDGLTNYDEFKLKTNPLEVDSDGDGLEDGLECLKGQDPKGGGVVNCEDFVQSTDGIVYKIQQKNIQNKVKSESGLEEEVNTYLNQLPIKESNGLLSIPKLGLENKEVLWGFDEEKSGQFVEELNSGKVINYSYSKLPGEVGNTYIFGDFGAIEDLNAQDEILLTADTNTNKNVTWKYVVTGMNLYEAGDMLQFKQSGVTEISLAKFDKITGSVLVVKGRLVSIQENVFDKNEEQANNETAI